MKLTQREFGQLIGAAKFTIERWEAGTKPVAGPITLLLEYEQIASVRPKTICQDFLEQIEISEELAGSHIRFSFTGKERYSLLSEATAYTREEKKRVQTILYQQMRKYKYLFD